MFHLLFNNLLISSMKIPLDRKVLYTNFCRRHPANHTPELNSFLNCLPQPQDQPGCIYNNGPCQTINMMPGASPGASPTSPISNKRSFNTRNTHSGPYIINHGHITIESTIYEGEDIDGAGTPTSRNQEKENESWEPSSPSVYCVCVPC